MALIVRNVVETELITCSSFVTQNRAQGDPVGFTVYSNQDSAMLRAVPYGVLFVGGVLTSLPRSFPFVSFQRFEVWQGGAAGLVFSPSTFSGYYALLFQPNENAVGQEWTLFLVPD